MEKRNKQESAKKKKKKIDAMPFQTNKTANKMSISLIILRKAGII